MKRTMYGVLLIALLFGVSAQAGVGEPDWDNEYANVGVFIIFDPDLPLPNVSTFCSGVLISPRHFLTAAHCLDWISTVGSPVLGVSFDNPAAPYVEATIPVTDYFIHPGYPRGQWTSNGSSPGPGFGLQHDLGILVLEDGYVDGLGITPAALPTEGYLDELARSGLLLRQQVVNVGYGVVPFLTGPPGYFPPNGIRRKSTSRAVGLTQKFLKQRHNIHAGDAGGSASGDSGSPKFLPDDASRTVLAITSWGDPPNRTMVNSVRVDTPTALEFIEHVLTTE